MSSFVRLIVAKEMAKHKPRELTDWLIPVSRLAAYNAFFAGMFFGSRIEVMMFFDTSSIALSDEELVISFAYLERIVSIAAANMDVPVFAISEDVIWRPIFASAMINSGNKSAVEKYFRSFSLSSSIVQKGAHSIPISGIVGIMIKGSGLRFGILYFTSISFYPSNVIMAIMKEYKENN